MSKCNEAYRKYLQEHPHTAVGFDHFACIWNIRGRIDAEICREQVVTPMLTDPAANAEMAIEHCAEAIEKENEQ